MTAASSRNSRALQTTVAIERAQLPLRLLLSIVVAIVYAATARDPLTASVWYALAAITLTWSALLHTRVLETGEPRRLAMVASVLSSALYAGLIPLY